MRSLVAALRKEVLLQWRTRARVVAVLVFGATALLLFSFAVGPDYTLLSRMAAGFLWLALLLSSTLTLAESFHTETEQRALEGLLLLPADPRALYYGKAHRQRTPALRAGAWPCCPRWSCMYDATDTAPAGHCSG